MNRIKQLLLSVALIAAFASQSFAQEAWNYRTGDATVAAGQIIPVVNFNSNRDSVINDGTWVMLDTLSTIKRIVVKPWIGTAATDHRFCGIAVGRIPGGNGLGKVLIQGYHPRAKMITGLTLMTSIGPSFAIYGAGGAMDDSLATAPRSSGVIIGYNPTTQASTGVPTARVFLTRIGSVKQ